MNRGDVLSTANKCVNGDRDQHYGTPEDSFQTIANLWNNYLIGKTGQLVPADVAAMMVLFKVARIKNQPGHKDSWIDVAGYAACGGEVSTRGENGISITKEGAVNKGIPRPEGSGWKMHVRRHKMPEELDDHSIIEYVSGANIGRALAKARAGQLAWTHGAIAWWRFPAEK